VVRRQARAGDLATVVPEGGGVVWAFVRAQQLQAGRNVAIYWDGSIRLEVGVELDGPLPDDPDVVQSATPEGLAASVVHLGPYNRLGTAHEAIRQWCAAHNYRLAAPNWEVYGHWQDEWNIAPSRIRTDVYYQLAASTAFTAGARRIHP
jgi:effector-binding domain-containing protein